MGESFTTNVDCGGIVSGTSIISTDKVNSIVKNMLYQAEPPSPSTEYEAALLNPWTSSSDVDTFFTNYTPRNGWNGLKLGNYIQINDGTYNTQWEIAGFNLEHNQTAADGTTYDNGYGICLIPKTSSDEMYHVWNDEDCRCGYINSSLHSWLNSTVYNNLKALLGNHIMSRNVLLSSHVGEYYSDEYTWTTAYLTSLSVGQCINTFASHSTKYDDGEANYYLPLFSHENYSYPNYKSSHFRNIYRYLSGDAMQYVYTARNSSLNNYFVTTQQMIARPMMYLR